jgi:hypothetical protein
MEVGGPAWRRDAEDMTYQVTMPGRSFLVNAITASAAEVCARQLLAAEVAKDPAVAEASRSLTVTARM